MLDEVLDVRSGPHRCRPLSRNAVHLVASPTVTNVSTGTAPSSRPVIDAGISPLTPKETMSASSTA